MLWQWVRNLLQQLPHSTSHNILHRDMSLPTYQHIRSCPSLPECTFSKHMHTFLIFFWFVNTLNKLGTNICLSVFIYFGLLHYTFSCLTPREDTKSHLKVDKLQIGYQSAEQATVSVWGSFSLVPYRISFMATRLFDTSSVAWIKYIYRHIHNTKQMLNFKFKNDTLNLSFLIKSCSVNTITFMSPSDISEVMNLPSEFEQDRPTFSAFLSEMSCFSSTVMLSLRFLTMSAGDLWDLPKGKGMAQSYHEQPGSGLSTWGMKCKIGSEPVKMGGMSRR